MVTNIRKKKIKILLALTLVFLWLFTGWPPLFQNPTFPPKIGKVGADTLTKTFTFDSNSESWSASSCGAAGATCIWQSGDGSPASGSLEEPETRKNKGGTWTWDLSGITWESLGIPTGSIVTVVDGSYNHTMATCTSCNTSGGNTSGTLSIRDSGDTTTIATLETAVSYTGTAAWAARNASGTQSIGASYQASSTALILRLSGSIQTNNTNGAVATIRQDEISLTFTYTTPVISVSITDGSVAYGTIAVNTSQDTTSSGLNDTQVATNDGDVAEDFNIKTSNAVGGTQWSLGSGAGADTFVHEFSTDSGGAWTKFTAADSYQALVSNVAVSGTQNVDFRITTPTSYSDTVQKTITVTVQAIAH